MNNWHDPEYVRDQVRRARIALARARRTYGQRSIRYAEKLEELQNTEYLLAQATAQQSREIPRGR